MTKWFISRFSTNEPATFDLGDELPALYMEQIGDDLWVYPIPDIGVIWIAQEVPDEVQADVGGRTIGGKKM